MERRLPNFSVGYLPRSQESGDLVAVRLHREDMAGTERLKPPAMFVPIKEGLQRKSDQSQKESRCQTKRSMTCGAENRSRCPLLNLSAPLRPRRDASSLLLCPACRSPLAHQALNARNQCLCARVTGVAASI